MTNVYYLGSNGETSALLGEDGIGGPGGAVG